MHRLRRRITLLSLMGVLALPAWASSVCQNGTQTSGALYLMCVPSDTWNGDLILFAHGYVVSATPIAVPGLVLPDGTYVPDLVTGLGYAFATTSYSTNGLAVPQGVADIVDLVSVFRVLERKPRRVFITGGSEGGLVAVKAFEEYPTLFNGALAACGPIGDFQREVDYLGDARVVFDYSFPGLLPSSAIDIPPELMSGWNSTYKPLVLPGTTTASVSDRSAPIGHQGAFRFEPAERR